MYLGDDFELIEEEGDFELMSCSMICDKIKAYIIEIYYAITNQRTKTEKI
jgi:hypothetical protein